ncbi:D-Tyr-tRNATyr deacylase [[Clostridium] ultunense Esp]|uniref:D-aminoacyl-tRNA deacylase n=1 Tax=Thermicanus aegyptius TaxID=94009 RepID=UPI0002B6FB04|nr:D-aminoacyl-tRNA deacylase [Thermicanus aegyptius]CCQ93295.1 D-Tyr-tRNATyr deacylase [[Clostridium] ultunense Esp]
MRVVVQRVKWAEVRVEGKRVGRIGPGLLLLVGFTHGDGEEKIRWMAEKVVHLRIFSDDEGRMNRSLLEVGGAILSVSQFTLYGDARKGRRPSFVEAARPEMASFFFDRFNEWMRGFGIEVETGVFGADMEVELLNDGPVTLLLDNDE